MPRPRRSESPSTPFPSRPTSVRTDLRVYPPSPTTQLTPANLESARAHHPRIRSQNPLTDNPLASLETLHALFQLHAQRIQRHRHDVVLPNRKYDIDHLLGIEPLRDRLPCLIAAVRVVL